MYIPVNCFYLFTGCKTFRKCFQSNKTKKEKTLLNLSCSTLKNSSSEFVSSFTCHLLQPHPTRHEPELCFFCPPPRLNVDQRRQAYPFHGCASPFTSVYVEFETIPSFTRRTSPLPDIQSVALLYRRRHARNQASCSSLPLPSTSRSGKRERSISPMVTFYVFARQVSDILVLFSLNPNVLDLHKHPRESTLNLSIVQSIQVCHSFPSSKICLLI